MTHEDHAREASGRPARASHSFDRSRNRADYFPNRRERYGWALRVWTLADPFVWSATPFLTEDEAKTYVFEMVDTDVYSYSIRPCLIALEVSR